MLKTIGERVSILRRGVLVVPAAVATVGALAASVPAEAGHNPRVLPPQSSPYGQSYGQWGAAWWQWAASFPAGADPIGEVGEVVYGASGQSGPVWFLAGTSGVAGVERSLALPVGKALFFPLSNIVTWGPEDCDGLLNEDFIAFLAELGYEFDPPSFACTADSLTYIARFAEDFNYDLTAVVDGQSLTNLDTYRGTSGAFTLPMDLFGEEGGTRELAVSDGHWIMLAPLTPGAHTISFGAKNALFEDLFGSFEVGVTYELTVGGS